MGVGEDIITLEQSLKELVIRYEQYFLGVEKREPLQLLGEIEAASRAYTNVNIVNTMWKFKYNATVAKLNSYKQYWHRINRLIEDGQYSRDRFKMHLHLQESVEKPRKAEPKIISDADKIFRSYIEARKACKMPTDNITPEMIAAVIEKQRPAIVQKYRCEKVDFQVVIEGGKPKIKARPR